MLALHRLSVGQHRYYLSVVPAGAADGVRLLEPDGRFIGSGAARLDLAGETVVPERLEALLAGRDPATGAVLDDRHGRVKVVAFDCTFAAPKAVSVLHALAPPAVSAEVQAAHEASLAASLGYLERQAARVRRRAGACCEAARTVPAASGLVAAAFLHRSSRAADPHLHTHAVVASLAADSDGNWSAIDSRGLYLHAQAASALYGAQLRAELSARLTVEIPPGHHPGRFPLVGIDRRLVEAFSRRSQAIADELAESGTSGPRAARVAAARTRPARDLSISYEELVEQWRSRAVALGLSVRRIEDSVRPRRREPARVQAMTATVPLGAVSRRSIIVATCAELSGGAPVEAVERLVDAAIGSRALVALAPGMPHLGRGARSFPAGVPEARVASLATMELRERWAQLVASSLPGGPSNAARQADAARHGPPPGESARLVSRLVLPGRGDLAALASAPAIAGLQRRLAGGGSPLVALVSGGARHAAAFEAVTGARAIAAGEIALVAPDATLIVEERLVERDPETAARLVEARASARRLVVATPALGGPDRDAVGDRAREVPNVAPEGDRVEVVRLDGAQVVLAEDPGALVEALRWRAWDVAGSDGPAPRPALVVVALASDVAEMERLLAAREGRRTAGPVPVVRHAGALAGELDAGPWRELLVVGPTSLVERGLGRSAGQRAARASARDSAAAMFRTHFAVCGPASSRRDRRARVLELAQPEPLVRDVGPAPLAGAAARERWRVAALAADARIAAAKEAATSPGMGHEAPEHLRDRPLRPREGHVAPPPLSLGR